MRAITTSRCLAPRLRHRVPSTAERPIERIRGSVVGDDVVLAGPFEPRRMVYADATPLGRALAYAEARRIIRAAGQSAAARPAARPDRQRGLRARPLVPAAGRSARALMLPSFLIPSVVWYGLEPLLDRVRLQPGAPDLSVEEWGGLLRGDDDLDGALATLDPVLLLLNLAGYQVPEVAIGVPASARETPAIELIAVDMRTMLYAKGTGHPYLPPRTTPPCASVALWLEPRYPAAHPALADGPTLALAGMAGALADESIALDFASLGTGWLRLSWPAGAELPAWPSDLARVVDVLSDALAGELEAQYFAAGAAAESNGGGTPLCGLLSLYDSRTWTEPVPPDPELDELTPLVGQFGDDLSTLLNGGADVAGIGLGEFLRAEIAPPPDGPLSTLDRWSLGAGADSRTIVESLSLCADELVDQSFAVFDDEDAAAEFAATAFRDLDTLPVTTLLMRWQELGVLDFLESIEKAVDVLFAGDAYGGYDLQRDDSDATFVYGGKQRSAAAGDVVPLPVEAGYVAQLRRDLAELGFGPLVGHTPDEAPVQAFDLLLERAVRELQLYADAQARRGDHRCGPFRFYAERLIRSSIRSPTAGRSARWSTRDARADPGVARRRLRCPVVIEARRKDAQKLHAALRRGGGHDGQPLARRAGPERRPPCVRARLHGALDAQRGQRRQGPGPGRPRARRVDRLGFRPGPWADAPTHTWAEPEILPESLTGSSFALWRTWRARPSGSFARSPRSSAWLLRLLQRLRPRLHLGWSVPLDDRAGDEEEPRDRRRGSSRPTSRTSRGSAATRPRVRAGVRRFGCGVTKSGRTAPRARLAVWFDRATARTRPGSRSSTRRGARRGRGANETAEWFRQWHWCFRFAMTARTNEAYRRRMWDYARLRVRDLLATPWHPRTVSWRTASPRRSATCSRPSAPSRSCCAGTSTTPPTCCRSTRVEAGAGVPDVTR